MKTLIIALAATGVALAAAPTESFAGSKHYKKQGKSYLGRTHHRRFGRRDYNRLPIRVTRPPNTGHYVYQDFPLWAARAFQPRRTR
ncbi:MAG: hypothetical protein JXQ99_24515 [Hyphomicrobiaceae bacterium]